MGKLIIANWKDNPETRKEAVGLAGVLDEESVAIAPPSLFLEAVRGAIAKADLCAQDIFWEDKGAFTGQISGSQLRDLGVKYVIVGHSEKRRLGDTDEIVQKKIAAALRNGLVPIICIGETRAERASGKSKEAVSRQLIGALSAVGHESSVISHKLFIAYEPVWAISTEPGSEADTPENAVSMIQFMKTLIQSRFIYGGSVNAQNAESFLRQSEIEGALVGGASLKRDEIKKIIEIARNQ